MPLNPPRALGASTIALIVLCVLSASGQPVEPPGLMERLQRLEGRVAQTEQRVARVEAASGVAAVEPEYGTVPLDGDVFPPALPEAAGAGFYDAAGELLGVFAPRTNLFDAIRDGLRQHDVLRVRLLAGETYGLTHTGRHNEAAWLGGKTLVVEATPGTERATLLVEPSTRDGRRRTPFVLGRQPNAIGHLRLDGVAIVSPGRMPSEAWSPVNFGGQGRLEILDSELADGHHGIDANRPGGHPGMDLLMERSLIRDVSSPARDLTFDGQRGSPSTGIFSGGYRRIVVRDSAFVRIGYRADGAERAIGNIYSHGIYLAVPARDPGEETTAELGDVLIERNAFVDCSAWMAQLRGGGVFRGNLGIDCAFGVTQPRGEIVDNVILRARRVWHRDGSEPDLVEIAGLGITDLIAWQRFGWHSHGGQGVNIAHEDKGSSPRYLHGPTTVTGNLLSDTAYAASGRAPIARERSYEDAPDVVLAGNVAMAWPHQGWGTPINPMPDPGTAAVDERPDSLRPALAAHLARHGQPVAADADPIDRLAELASHLPRGGGDARFGANALVGEGVAE